MKPFTQLLSGYCEASGMKLNAIAAAAFISYRTEFRAFSTRRRMPPSVASDRASRPSGLATEASGTWRMR